MYVLQQYNFLLTFCFIFGNGLLGLCIWIGCALHWIAFDLSTQSLPKISFHVRFQVCLCVLNLHKGCPKRAINLFYMMDFSGHGIYCMKTKKKIRRMTCRILPWSLWYSYVMCPNWYFLSVCCELVGPSFLTPLHLLIGKKLD